MEADFRNRRSARRFRDAGGEADILQRSRFIPPPDVVTPDGGRGMSFGGFHTAFGRLKPGVTPQQAQAAVASIIEENGKGLPRITQDQGQPRVVPLRDYLVGDAARVAWLLLGAVAGLLLIACVNVANLILARMAARNREFAVRSALGAGRARLARLALTESLMLAVTAAASDYCSLPRCYESSCNWRRPAFQRSTRPRSTCECSPSPQCSALAAGRPWGSGPRYRILRHPQRFQSGSQRAHAARAADALHARGRAQIAVDCGPCSGFGPVVGEPVEPGRVADRLRSKRDRSPHDVALNPHSSGRFGASISSSGCGAHPRDFRDGKPRR
jgi:hypothetical protein